VLRGGSWNNNTRRNLLSSNRNNNHPAKRNDNNGFRVVMRRGSGGKACDHSKALARPAPATQACAAEPGNHTPNPRLPAPEKIPPGDQGKYATRRVAGPERRSPFVLTGTSPERLAPGASHPPDLIQFLDGEKKLLLGDPASLRAHPPEEPELFEREIQCPQTFDFFDTRPMQRFQRLLQQVESPFFQTGRQHVAFTTRKRLQALDRPAQQVANSGVNRRWG